MAFIFLSLPNKLILAPFGRDKAYNRRQECLRHPSCPRAYALPGDKVAEPSRLCAVKMTALLSAKQGDRGTDKAYTKKLTNLKVKL